LVVLPLVPVIVIVRVPVAARRFTVTVIVDDPLPPDTELGLNDSVTRLPWPEPDNDTVPVNPFEGVTVMVEVFALPRVIVSDVGVFENATMLGGMMLTAAGAGGTGLKGLFGAPLPPPQPPRNASPVNAKHVKIHRSQCAAKLFTTM